MMVVMIMTLATSAKRELQLLLTPTEGQIANFYSQLSETPGRPVILALIPGYSDAYVPTNQLSDYPKLLTDFFESSAKALTFNDLTF